MQSRFLHIAVLLLLTGTSFLWASDIFFRSAELQSLYYRVFDPGKPDSFPLLVSRDTDTTSGFVTIYYAWTVSGEPVNLKTEFSDDSTLSHIGVTLFPETARYSYHPAVYNFLERMLLQALVMPAAWKERMLEAAGINLLFDKSSVSFSESNLVELIIMAQGGSDFRLRHTGDRYSAEWESDSGKRYALQFPAEAELLTAMDKQESDYYIFDALASGSSAGQSYRSPAPTAPATLLLFNEDILVAKGSSIFPGLNTDRYFVKIGGDTIPVFAREHLALSLNNYFKGLIVSADGRSIAIRQSLYGNQFEQVEARFDHMMNVLSNGMDIYTGTEPKGEGYLVIVLFYSHKLNMSHLLSVNVADINAFFDPSATLHADLYTNIRTDNIKEIFQEYVESDKRFRIKVD